jgi:hypothetical protein
LKTDGGSEGMTEISSYIKNQLLRKA